MYNFDFNYGFHTLPQYQGGGEPSNWYIQGMMPATAETERKKRIADLHRQATIGRYTQEAQQVPGRPYELARGIAQKRYENEQRWRHEPVEEIGGMALDAIIALGTNVPVMTSPAVKGAVKSLTATGKTPSVRIPEPTREQIIRGTAQSYQKYPRYQRQNLAETEVFKTPMEENMWWKQVGMEREKADLLKQPRSKATSPESIYPRGIGSTKEPWVFKPYTKYETYDRSPISQHKNVDEYINKMMGSKKLSWEIYKALGKNKDARELTSVDKQILWWSVLEPKQRIQLLEQMRTVPATTQKIREAAGVSDIPLEFEYGGWLF